jgi:hypothetical protein
MTNDDKPGRVVIDRHRCGVSRNRRLTSGRDSALMAPHGAGPLPQEYAMNRILSAATLGLALIGAGLATFVPSQAEAATRRGRVVKTDGEGNATVATGAAARGLNGATAARAGLTTRGADGSIQHDSGMRAEGTKGSVASSGSASRSAAGAVTQNRTTTATSATSGNSVQSTSSYNKDSGRTRTTTCYDAAGATIACPARP